LPLDIKFSGKMHEFDLGCGWAPDPAGRGYCALPDLV